MMIGMLLMYLSTTINKVQPCMIIKKIGSFGLEVSAKPIKEVGVVDTAVSMEVLGEQDPALIV